MINDFTVSTEEILRECEAAEIEGIFGNTLMDFADHNLILSVHDRIEKKFHSKRFALDVVYLLGYIYGIRAERKRRKNKGYVSMERSC